VVEARRVKHHSKKSEIAASAVSHVQQNYEKPFLDFFERENLTLAPPNENDLGDMS